MLLWIWGDWPHRFLSVLSPFHAVQRSLEWRVQLDLINYSPPYLSYSDVLSLRDIPYNTTLATLILPLFISLVGFIFFPFQSSTDPSPFTHHFLKQTVKQHFTWGIFSDLIVFKILLPLKVMGHTVFSHYCWFWEGRT